MFQTTFLEKIKKRHFKFQTFSPKSSRFMITGKNMVEQDRSQMAIKYNTVQALYMQDNKGYRHRLRICNT